jgi:hypothetical protein
MKWEGADDSLRGWWKGVRHTFWYWLLRVARVPEGNILPKWAVVVRWILTPIEMLRFVFSDYSDGGGWPVLRFGGAKWDAVQLERMLRPGAEPFRVLRVENGWAVVERMREGLCQWRGGEPCNALATHDLIPARGTPSRMCAKHYKELQFLEIA